MGPERGHRQVFERAVLLGGVVFIALVFQIIPVSLANSQEQRDEYSPTNPGELGSDLLGSPNVSSEHLALPGQDAGQRRRPNGLSSPSARRGPENLVGSGSNVAAAAAASTIVVNNKRLPSNNGEPERKHTNARKHDDALSTDCISRRSEVLSRQSSTPSIPTRVSTVSPPMGYQRIKPKVENSLPSGSPLPRVINETSLANGLDGEHVPRCKSDGSYEPIQCHKIGYCWCVNKYGQAIKNSAVMSGEELFCEPSMYEVESDDLLVVAGISKQRLKNLLKNDGSPIDTSSPNGHINFEATEPSVEATEPDDHQQVDSGNGRSINREPAMPLIPNDCGSSRLTARDRAMKHMNDSIWVPECDSEDERLYSERQCHKLKVCWCVDQVTGLPLRTSEQLSPKPANSNCTELRKILELTSNANKAVSSRPTPQPAFYQGSSEFCDAEKRSDFVVALSNQFRQQISEYVRQNPTSMAPDSSSSNPYAIGEAQVAKWKFNLMDKDLDGKLGDREWSKFKNNFKLVDKADELDNPFKQQKSPNFSLTPLLIVRSQRKCWRDFLEFCGSGDLLVDESISLSKWLSCTEVPSKFIRRTNNNRGQSSSAENTYAHSREAAIVRSKMKNPFLGILKPD